MRPADATVALLLLTSDILRLVLATAEELGVAVVAYSYVYKLPIAGVLC